MEPRDHSTIVHIRNKDCLNLTTGFNTHIQVELKEPLERMTGHKFHISLSSAEIPYVWYNISSYLVNNKIEISDSSGDVVITLSDGNYDIFDLINDLNANASFPFSTLFDSKTYKVTFTNASVDTKTIRFDLESSKGMAKILGFSETMKTVNSSASVTSEGVVNMRPIHSLYLHSNLAASNVITSQFGAIENIIDKIPLGEVGPSQIITYDPYETAPFTSIIVIDSINIFELSLRDQNNRLLQLNDVSYEISLLIEQRLDYEYEKDHPNRRYLEVGSQPTRRMEINTSSPVTMPSPTLQPERTPNTIKTKDLTSITVNPKPSNAMPSVVTAKRPRLDEEHFRKQEIELNNALLLASAVTSD